LIHTKYNSIKLFMSFIKFKNTLTWLLIGWLKTKEFLYWSGVFIPFKDVDLTGLKVAADK